MLNKQTSFTNTNDKIDFVWMSLSTIVILITSVFLVFTGDYVEGLTLFVISEVRTIVWDNSES